MDLVHVSLKAVEDIALVAIAYALWCRKIQWPELSSKQPDIHVHVPAHELPVAAPSSVVAQSPAVSHPQVITSGMAYIMKRDGEDWIPHRLRAFGSREDETTWDADLVMALDHPGLGIRWPDEREVQTCRKNT